MSQIAVQQVRRTSIQRVLGVGFAFVLLAVSVLGQGNSSPADKKGTSGQTQSSSKGQSVTGDWEGAISINSQNMKLILHIKGSAKEGWTATLDSPDQQATGLPVNNITVSGSKINFELTSIQAKYAGELNQKQNSIAGTWSQLGMTWPVTFTKMNKAAAS